MGFPAYSQDGLAARDIFFRVGFEVQFFVEDDGQENFYEELLGRLFRRVGAIKVLPLGGKLAVLRHASETIGNSDFKRVYILDKDFDDLLGSKVIDERIFYTDEYCIECALIEEDAIVQLLVEESPTIRRAEIKRRLAFDSALKKLVSELDRLFRAYFLVQKHDLGVENCGAPVARFLSSSGASLDNRKIEDYEKKVSSLLVEKGVIASAGDYADLSRRSFGSARIFRKHISGKYLLDLLLAVAKKKSLMRAGIRRDSVAIRMSRNVSLSRLGKLRRDVNRYIVVATG